MIEEWKSVPSFPGWEASSLGRVRRPSAQIPMPNGGTKTLCVEATFGHYDAKKNRRKQNVNGRVVWVSVLVCEAFHGPKPDPSLHCLHVDEDSTNNAADNLEWGTRSRNQSMPLCRARRSAAMTRYWSERRRDNV